MTGRFFMRIRARLTITAIAFGLSSSIGMANDLAAFSAAVDDVASHYRLAASYLRTGNADLGGLEVDQVRAAWITLTKSVRANTPDAFRSNPLFGSTLEQVSYHTEKAVEYVDHGNLKAAEREMISIRDALSQFRRANNLYLLADCVLDANRAMDALYVYETTPPNLSEQSIAAAVQSSAEVYEGILRRCDRMASDRTKQDPEFRRLIDGATASLSLIPKAAREHDSGLLHRVLIEMRSFDNLLFFRFG